MKKKTKVEQALLKSLKDAAAYEKSQVNLKTETLEEPNTIFMLIIFYLCLNFIPFLNGLLDADKPPLYNDCDDPVARIEYVFPGFRVGCYLGSPPNSNKE